MIEDRVNEIKEFKEAGEYIIERADKMEALVLGTVLEEDGKMVFANFLVGSKISQMGLAHQLQRDIDEGVEMEGDDDD